jgi:hypothetical protein
MGTGRLVYSVYRHLCSCYGDRSIGLFRPLTFMETGRGTGPILCPFSMGTFSMRTGRFCVHSMDSMGTGRLAYSVYRHLWGQVDLAYGDRSILWDAAMDAAGMNPRTLALFDTGPIRKSERIKNPNVKHETRSAVQTLSERLGLGASHSTYRLMVAGGKAERTSTLDRVERAQPQRTKRRCCSSKDTKSSARCRLTERWCPAASLETLGRADGAWLGIRQSFN